MVTLLLGTAGTLVGCATSRPKAPPPKSAADVDATSRAASSVPATAPKVVTVPALKQMAEEGTTVYIMFGKIQGSGTVYRLTTEQTADLRADGMPVTLISYMQQTYEHATRANPALATSDEKWTQIDGFWYGGLPFGWPRDWVVGAPAPGEVLRPKKK